MKSAIIFKSDYGSTKRYAIKISEQLHCDILDVKYINDEKLHDYDTFIFCSNIINNQLTILPFIKKHILYLHDKQIVIIANCINDTHPDVSAYLASAFSYIVPIFYVQGSVKHSIHFIHTLGILKSYRYYRKHPQLLNSIKHGSIPQNWSSLNDIINYIQQMMNIDVPKPILKKQKIDKS